MALPVMVIPASRVATNGYTSTEIIPAPIKINFQLAGSPTVGGYLQDNGNAFASRNGLSYGWNGDFASDARDRNRNADQLVDTFPLAAVDPSIAEVHLRGAGPAFCAGGDLDEFGSFPDPATAHLVRLQQSVGRCIASVADRVTAAMRARDLVA